MNPNIYNSQPVDHVLNANPNPLGTFGQANSQPQSASSILSGINGLAQSPQTSQPAPDTGNWFTKLIPTLGSIGGGILGGIGGSFIAPVAGSFAGGIAGASAGDALGKSIENALEGKDTSMQDLGGAALEGAGGQLLGAGIGKVIGGVGKIVGNVGEKGLVAQGVADTAAQKVADLKDIGNVYGGVSKGTTQGIYNNQNLNGALDLAKGIGANHLNPQELVDNSNTALNNLAELRSNAVGAGGAINTAGAVDTQGNKIVPSINDIINAALHGTHPVTGEGIGTDLTNTLGSTDLIAGANKRLVMPNNASTQFLDYAKQKLGVLQNSTTDPEALLNASTQIGRDAQTARNLASNTSESDVTGINAAKAQAMTNLDNHLNDMLYNRPSVDAAVAGLPGVTMANGETAAPGLGQFLNDKVASAQTGKDLNGIMSQFMNMRNQGQSALEVAGNPANSGAIKAAQALIPETQGGTQVAGNGLGDIIGSSNHPLGKILGSALKIGSQGGATGKVAVNLGSVLQRIAPISGVAAGQTIANSPNYGGPANANTAIGGNMQPTGIGSSGNPVADILNSSSPNTIALKQLLSLTQNGGGYNVPSEMAAYAAPAADELKSLNSVNSAQSQLASLVDLYNKAGGAQGPMGGLLAKLSGIFTGNPAASYDRQAQQLAEQISQLTGTHINAPSLTMNQSSANGVLAQLQAALASYGGGGGVSSLGGLQ